MFLREKACFFEKILFLKKFTKRWSCLPKKGWP